MTPFFFPESNPYWGHGSMKHVYCSKVLVSLSKEKSFSLQ